MRRRLRALLSVSLRLAISLLVFVLIFRTIELGEVLQTMLGASPALLLLGLAFQLLSTLLASYRWTRVMQRLGFAQHFPFYLRSYFKGSFFNQGLPTSVGGDALRVLDVARTGHRKRDAFYGVAVDRGLGLAGLLLFNLLAHWLAPALLPGPVFWLLNGIAIGGLLGFVLLHWMQRLAWLEHWGPSRVIRRIAQRLAAVLASPSDWLQHSALSLAIHMLTLLAIFSLGRAVGLEFSLLTYMVIVPPVILLTLIPISLAGWGVREGGMIGLFALIGGEHTLVLSMSILYGVTLIVSSLPGLYAYLSGKHHL